MIWKIKYKTTDIYINILTEIQSSNDVTMPIRIWDYVGSSVEDVAEMTELSIDEIEKIKKEINL